MTGTQGPGSRLRAVVDVRCSTRHGRPAFELVGECGHVVDVHQWRGLSESDVDAHRRLHVGLRRKRCKECAA